VNTYSLSCPRDLSLHCDVAGYGWVAMTPESFTTYRRNPGRSLGESVSPSLLRHADPQTVAGLAAALKAMHEHDLTKAALRGWGVISGPCLLGRQAIADAMQRFCNEGALAIPPHLIPHESPHAVSGMLSQLLGLHGPNLSAGGGPGAVEDALLCAATVLAGDGLPGLWLVLTEFSPESIPSGPQGAGLACAPWVCHAVALALVPEGSRQALDLHVAITGFENDDPDMDLPPLSPATLGAALTRLTDDPPEWRLRYGARFLLSRCSERRTARAPLAWAAAF